jgi:hypothetical protein
VYQLVDTAPAHCFWPMIIEFIDSTMERERVEM